MGDGRGRSRLNLTEHPQRAGEGCSLTPRKAGTTGWNPGTSLDGEDRKEDIYHELQNDCRRPLNRDARTD